MKLQVFIPVSFEQSFSEKTSFAENEFLCWATGEGGRKKLHGTTENLPSSKQSSGSRISANIYVLKLGMYDSGFLQKIQLYPTIHSSLNKLCVTTYEQLWLFPSTQGPWRLLTLRLLKSHILLKPSKTGQPCPIYRWLLGTALLPDNCNLDILCPEGENDWHKINPGSLSLTCNCAAFFGTIPLLMAKRIRTKVVYTAFQLTIVFFPLLISNSFHFNGTAEYILDILKISSFY